MEKAALVGTAANTTTHLEALAVPGRAMAEPVLLLEEGLLVARLQAAAAAAGAVAALVGTP